MKFKKIIICLCILLSGFLFTTKVYAGEMGTFFTYQDLVVYFLLQPICLACLLIYIIYIIYIGLKKAHKKYKKSKKLRNKIEKYKIWLLVLTIIFLLFISAVVS